MLSSAFAKPSRIDHLKMYIQANSIDMLPAIMPRKNFFMTSPSLGSQVLLRGLRREKDPNDAFVDSHDVCGACVRIPLVLQGFCYLNLLLMRQRMVLGYTTAFVACGHNSPSLGSQNLMMSRLC